MLGVNGFVSVSFLVAEFEGHKNLFDDFDDHLNVLAVLLA
jgi:hypothetical protein